MHGNVLLYRIISVFMRLVFFLVLIIEMLFFRAHDAKLTCKRSDVIITFRRRFSDEHLTQRRNIRFKIIIILCYTRYSIAATR